MRERSLSSNPLGLGKLCYATIANDSRFSVQESKLLSVFKTLAAAGRKIEEEIFPSPSSMNYRSSGVIILIVVAVFDVGLFFFCIKNDDDDDDDDDDSFDNNVTKRGW